MIPKFFAHYAWVFYIIILTIQQNYFQYLTKFLDIWVKLFFSCAHLIEFSLDANIIVRALP